MNKIWYWIIRGLHYIIWYMQAPLDHLEWLFQEWEFQAEKKADFQ